MRTGSTQATPTASPKVTVLVNGDTHTTEGGSGNDLLVSVKTDEQAWGGQYTITLDNSGETLNAKDYVGYELTLTMGFVGETGSKFHNLWVQSQTFTSYEGKLLLVLNCIDIWGFLSMCSTTLGYTAWNQWWQENSTVLADNYTLPNGSAIPADIVTEMCSCYNKTIFEIVTALLGFCVETIPQLPAGETDSIIDVIKPPFSCSHIVTGVRQLMDMTKCFLKPRRDNLLGAEPSGGTLRVWNPALHDTVHAFSTANTHFISMQDDAFVAPNDIYVWAWNAAGTDIISNTAVRDAEAYAQFDVPAHYWLGDMNTDNRSDIATLTLIAGGILDKVQGSVSQGVIIAPMHCSLELFDKVSITDPRYSTPKVSTGYVFRMQREYDRGVYKITIQLGGVTSGYVPPKGSPSGGLADLDLSEYSTPVIPSIDWSAILPNAIQGYQTDVTFSATDNDDIAWTGGGAIGIKFYDGSVQLIAAGTLNLATTAIYYIYFDLASATPTILKSTTDYKSVMTQYTGLLCLAQKASVSTMKAVVIPSYGKTPLITADFIDMTGLKEYTYSDTTKLYSLLSTQVQAGAIKLSANTVYDTNYDPSSKKRVFVSEPTTPYNIGDLYYAATIAKRCSTARATGAYNAADWTNITQDDITNGSTYYRVLGTQLDAGRISLTETNYYTGKFSQQWYKVGGVVIDAVNGISLYGNIGKMGLRTYPSLEDFNADTNCQCYVGTDGKIYAGGGNVYLDANGLLLKSGQSYLRFLDGSGNMDGGIGYDGSNYLVIHGYNSNGVALEGATGAYGAGGGTAYIKVSGTDKTISVNSHIYNDADNTYDLGGLTIDTTVFEWRRLYCNIIYTQTKFQDGFRTVSSGTGDWGGSDGYANKCYSNEYYVATGNDHWHLY